MEQVLSTFGKMHWLVLGTQYSIYEYWTYRAHEKRIRTFKE